MNNTSLESLLIKAKELEHKYEWLQAAKSYKKISELIEKEKHLLKLVALHEQMGFCFYKAALRANNNVEFRNLMELSNQSYEKELKILKEIKKENQKVKIIYVKARIAYTNAWLEITPVNKRIFLSKWWAYEKQLLEIYEKMGNLYSVGKTCNDIVQLSVYDHFFIVASGLEKRTIYEECLKLAEKAIKILSSCNDDYELARAYCFAGWYYSFSNFFTESVDTVLKLNQKCQDYLIKALEISKKIGDAWLISWVYNASWMATQNITFNPTLAISYSEKSIEYGEIAKDNYIVGAGKLFTSFTISYVAVSLEDPDKQKESFEKAKKMGQEAINHFQIIHNLAEYSLFYPYFNQVLIGLASIETDPKIKQTYLEEAIKSNKECEKSVFSWKYLLGFNFQSSSVNLLLLSETKNTIKEKNDLLLKAQSYSKQFISFLNETLPFFDQRKSVGYYQLALVQSKLANIEKNNSEKIKLLNQASNSMKESIKLITKNQKLLQTAWASGFYFAKYYGNLGKILHQLYLITKEKKSLNEAIEPYEKASFYFKKAEMPTHVAESYWQIAQLHDELGKLQEASKNYELASEEYDLAVEKIPQLKEFYNDYSLYMRAWSQIEQAKASHSIEAYDEARQNYEQAAKLHESTSSWNYLTPNYLAWARIEEAESLSREEKAQQAKQTFQKAFDYFCNAGESFKQKIEEITSLNEKEMVQKLFKASDLRQDYCQARILLEDAKLLEREGNYLLSSRSYGEAAQKVSAIVDKVDNEAERKELEYVAVLCRAWEKMIVAEEATSAESYLEAAELFEEAKDYCYTSKASMWALGNSNFCRGLAAGANYQTNLDLAEHAKAKSFMKNASTHYEKAGFKSASEYAKATLRLFDAYLFMNQAESEADQSKRAKHYQMAENLLQIAAGSFMKAKQPKKEAQVQGILSNVREEKALAVSLSQVMQAPSIASSTLSFAAPTPTNEVSVGLESFEHANVQANLVTNVKEVKIGESFCLSIEFVNAGREPALLMRVDDFIPLDFVVVKRPEIYRIEESCLNMKGKQLAPLKLVEVKLTLQPSKKGQYQLNPKVLYLDELGQNKNLRLKTLEIKVEEVVMEDRVTTGTPELDSLLLGGIPEEYAVVLSGSPSDERELIVKNFLEAGAKEEVTFYIATEANNLEGLLENLNFFLFLCNPKPKTNVPDLPNVHKLQGKADITNLGIALTKANRNLDQSVTQKRICVEILSDVLVKHGTNTTREWISELITDLGAKGFTMMAVVNPRMHASEDLYAVLDLFDGEISITQSDDPLDCKKSIHVKKLRNQEYIKNPICLT